MKRSVVNGIEREARRLLRRDKKCVNEEFTVHFTLIHKAENKYSRAYAFNESSEIAVLVKPNYSNPKEKVVYLSDWAFSFEDDLFQALEEQFEIGSMSISTHYSIWCEIEQCYPEDIEHKEGLQKYLQYCKNNRITKELIEKERGLDLEIDAMKYYQAKKQINQKNIKENELEKNQEFDII